MTIRELFVWTTYLGIWLALTTLPDSREIFSLIVLLWLSLAILCFRRCGDVITLIYLMITATPVYWLPTLQSSKGPSPGVRFVASLAAAIMTAWIVWMTIRVAA